jgi:hypothetical protein
MFYTGLLLLVESAQEKYYKHACVLEIYVLLLPGSYI